MSHILIGLSTQAAYEEIANLRKSLNRGQNGIPEEAAAPPPNRDQNADAHQRVQHFKDMLADRRAAALAAFSAEDEGERVEKLKVPAELAWLSSRFELSSVAESFVYRRCWQTARRCHLSQERPQRHSAKDLVHQLLLLRLLIHQPNRRFPQRSRRMQTLPLQEQWEGYPMARMMQWRQLKEWAQQSAVFSIS